MADRNQRDDRGYSDGRRAGATSSPGRLGMWRCGGDLDPAQASEILLPGTIALSVCVLAFRSSEINHPDAYRVLNACSVYHFYHC
jgi:hypothetical protein